MIPLRPFERKNALHYGFYFASRLLPHPKLRIGVASAIRATVNARHSAEKPSPHTDAHAILQRLKDEGLAIVPGPLSGEQIDDILAYLRTVPAAQGSPDKPVTIDTQGLSSAAYDAPTILGCPHLLQAMNHPDLLQVAAGFLGCKPTLSGVGLRWSFARNARLSDVQRFHRDTEDWRILRLFIYLTDVFPDCGPHQFVAQSHKTAGRFRLQPYSEQQIDSKFGRDKVVTINGPRGTAFMGDMWGVHRGVPPSGRPRLLFNCTYTMTATPIFEYKPVRIPDAHLYDRHTNRLLIC